MNVSCLTTSTILAGVLGTVFAVTFGEAQPGLYPTKSADSVPVSKEAPQAFEGEVSGPIEPAGPLVGKVVVVTHRVSVASVDIEENVGLPSQSRSVGWLVQTEPQVMLAMTRWDGTNPPEWWTIKRFPAELVISVDLAFDPD